MSRVIPIFATRTDLLDLLAVVEATRTIHYVEAGMFDKPVPTMYGSASEIPDLGTIYVTDTNLGPIFLLADARVSFVVRPVPQRRGGVRYAMDQQENPDTVSLHQGGQFDDRTILAGSIGTCTESRSEASAALLNVIASVVRRQWVRIQSYAVGPEAEKVLDAGGRLTRSLQSPHEYDLRR